MTAKTASRAKAKRTPPGEEGVTYDWLRVGDLEIDRRIQRDVIRANTLDEIRKKYNRRSLNTLVVSQRADGKLYLVDGQHRAIVVKEKEPDGEDARVYCCIHTGLSLQEEAKLFVELNNQTAASPLDLHKARVTQQDPTALALDAAAKAYEWGIGSGARRIAAVRVLEQLYYAAESEFDGYGRVLVENTIGVITNAWGNDDAKVMSQPVLKAVGELALDVEAWCYATGKPDDYFDYDVLATAMHDRLKAGATGWVAAQRGSAKASGKSIREALRESLVDIYNKSQTRKALKLPEELRRPKTRKVARAPEVDELDETKNDAPAMSR
jgi:hypothetical protein